MAQKLAETLTAARRAVFVGREREQKRFAEILSGAKTPGVFWLHGPGGVGKSTLLREWAETARALKIQVALLDGRHMDASPAGFLQALTGTLGLPISDGATPQSVLEVIEQYFFAKNKRIVILVDTVEFLAPLETWWREEFLPVLPENVFLILAGRKMPDSIWSSDPGWRELIHVQALRNLNKTDATDYLKRRGLPAAQHDSILQFTHGHPLALSLVADVFEQRKDADAEEIALQFTPEDAPEVVRTLLNQLVEGETSAGRRAALEACALVRLTTEDLLAALLGEDAHNAFGWLRSLSFIETGRQGVFPHDMAREVLLADLRWRNPAQHRLLHERAREFYSARFQQAAAPEQQRILMDYVFLHRHNPMVRPFLDWRENNMLVSGPMRAEESKEIIAIVKKHEGKESAALTQYWIAAQPQNVTVMRDPQGTIQAFMMLVSLPNASASQIAFDPATKAAWKFLEKHAPLRPGEESTILRFWMARDSYQDISPAQSLIFVNAVRHNLTTPHLAFTFFPCAAPEFLAPLFTYASATRLSEVNFTVGGRDYGVFGHDWRALPSMQWLDLLGEREVNAAAQYNAAAAPSLDVLTREVFFDAVREALRDWHRPDDLRKNPLLRTRLVVNRAGRNAANSERVAALQSLIREACESMRSAKRESKFLRALYHSYIKPAPTQERAAEAMDVPFSTYRRYLKSGLDTVANFLWSREIGG